MSHDLGTALASAVRRARNDRGLSVAALSDLSGVSRAMIGKVERGDAQPTAALLGRLSAALGLTLSQLIAGAEGDARRLSRAADQPVWVDPVSAYRRRAVSPPSSTRTELIDVILPPGATVSFPAENHPFFEHLFWVLDGLLDFHEGDEVHHLAAGDSLHVSVPTACSFVNPGTEDSRYVCVLTHRGR